MNLTQDQGEAMRAIGAFFTDPEAKLFRLTGSAGVGKTTIIRLISQAWQRPFHVLTPTGRAALRVKEATGLPAKTIHKFLYTPKVDQETGDVTFALRGSGDMEKDAGGLIVIDEASMVSRKLWDDLMTATAAFDMKVLVAGDTFQLEPVGDDSFCPLSLQTDHRADMTEVVRQALDSPVMRAATGIRLSTCLMDTVKALAHLDQMGDEEAAIRKLVDHPEIPALVHQNVTRHRINNMVRKLKGYAPGTLLEGEPLLVTKNCYPLDLYNGEVIPVKKWLTPLIEQGVVDRKTKNSAILRLGLADVGRGDETAAAALCSNEVSGDLHGTIGNFWVEVGYKAAWKSRAISGEWDSFETFVDHRGVERTVRLKPAMLHANYGYCLTAHKSQGSEWDEVSFLVEPSINLSTVSGRRFAYTAITRAKRRVYLAYA